MLAPSPSNVATVNPAHSASAASSVKSVRPSRAARRCASRITSYLNACGVCAIRKRARSGVASTWPRAVDQLDGVVHGNRGNRRAGRAGSLDRARNHRRRDERPRRVMDQHDVGLLRSRALPARHAPRPGASRRPASAAACCRPATGRVEHGAVVGVQHRLHGDDIGMPAERLHGAVDHGLAADHPVLLRSAGAGAQAAAGGDKDGSGAQGFRHGTSVQLTEMRGGVVAAGPYHASCRNKRAIPDCCDQSTFCCTALARSAELSKV